jgi:ADP-ribosyl-[dinitrogen reductase] hydrolase
MKVRTSKTNPIEIATIPVTGVTGAIGVTFCPGKKGPSLFGTPWDRCLDTDLACIVEWGATTIVTLMEPAEFHELQVSALGKAVKAAGLNWFHLPIRDGGAPSPEFEESWRTVGASLRDRLRRGERILVHCRGGRGRAGMIAAVLLVEMGEDPEAAIRRVRSARPGAIETLEQCAYVRSCRSVVGASSGNHR